MKFGICRDVAGNVSLRAQHLGDNIWFSPKISQILFLPMITQISVEELATRLADSSEGLQLVDVREPQEVEIASLAGFASFPLSQFDRWSDSIRDRLNPDAEIIVLCHHGIRSAQMCQWLVSQGFTDVKNVSGGIDAYSTLVDRSIPQY
jgi:rhodanese-related sulfurtransferase